MSGSDAAEMRTLAARRGGEYVLDGSKNYITNGAAGGHDPRLRHDRPREAAQGHHRLPRARRDAKGFTRGKPDEKVGHPRLRRPARSSSRGARPRALPARRGGRRLQDRDGHARRRPHRHRRARRSGSRARRSRRPRAYAKERKAFGQVIARASRPSSSCSPTWPPSSTRRACSCCARGGAQGPGRAPHARRARWRSSSPPRCASG